MSKCLVWKKRDLREALKKKILGMGLFYTWLPSVSFTCFFLLFIFIFDCFPKNLSFKLKKSVTSAHSSYLHDAFNKLLAKN